MLRSSLPWLVAVTTLPTVHLAPALLRCWLRHCLKVLHGDALYGEKEFRRALSAYKQAMQYSKSIPRQTTSATRISVSNTGRSPSPNSSNLMPFNENEVKSKIALCHSALHEYREALQEMEGIPSKVRSLKMNLMLGKLYRISRNNCVAAVCYKECLRTKEMKERRRGESARWRFKETVVRAANCGELARIEDGALAARVPAGNRERYRQTDRNRSNCFSLWAS